MADGFVVAQETYVARHDAYGLTLTPEAGQPLELSTAHFFRDGALLRGEGPARIDADGHLVIAGEGVVEHLRTTEEGCEQSWSFASKPNGSGALTLRIATRGMEHVATTSSGLHFADEHHRGLRYGHATFVDAAGTRTPVAAQWVAGDIVLSVSESLLDGAVYPATLDPIISPEIEVDTGSVSLDGIGESPDVAAGAGEFFMVWTDTRSGTYDVYGARVSAGGALLDPLPTVISAAAGAQKFPRVAFDGTNFIVTWQDDRGGSNAIYAARVTSAGVLLDSTGVRIATTGTTPAIASSGASSLVVWQGGALGTQAIRMSGSLALLDAAPQDLSCIEPAVAYDGAQYMVACNRKSSLGSAYGTVYGFRISTAGIVLDPTGIKIGSSNMQRLPSVAAEGSMFLVVWEDRRISSTSGDIYGARVTSTGLVADVTGFAVTSVTTNDETTPSVAFDGTNFVVVWRIFRYTGINESWVVRVSTSGSVFDPAPAKVGATVGPRIANDGSHSLVATFFSAVYATRLTAITPSPSVVVSKIGSAQYEPAIAWDGSEWLVVWSDTRGSDNDLYATRISKTGIVLDPSGILISNAVDKQVHPAVASNGSEFFVVWTDGRAGSDKWSVYGARVSKAGALVVGSEKKMIASVGSVTTLALTSDGAGYALFANAPGELRGFPFSSDGTLLSASGFLVSSGISVAAVYDGTAYYVVWTELLSGSDWNIMGRSMTSSGAMGATTTITAAVGKQIDPAVAYGGSRYLVVWTDYRDGDANIYGARVSSGGAVVDPFAIAVSNAVGDQSVPTVIFDGTDFVAAWQDKRGSNSDIYGARISAAGVILDPTGFVISAALGDETEPTFIRGDVGKGLVAYRAYNGKYGSPRVVARTYGATAAPSGACTSSADCGGGPCVDGMCCNSACGGGATNDCQACSVAAGAAVDGTCGPVKATTVCRGATGPCDVAEKCDGVALACPINGFASDGTACDDGFVCNGVAVCAAGLCTAGASPSCDDGDGCTVDTCAEPAGCTHSPIASCDAGTDAAPDSSADSSTPDTTSVDTSIDDSSTDSLVSDSLADSLTADTTPPSDTATEDALVDTGTIESDAAETAETPAADSSGCGCELPRTSRGPGAWLLGLVFLAAARRRRASRPLSVYARGGAARRR